MTRRLTLAAGLVLAVAATLPGQLLARQQARDRTVAPAPSGLGTLSGLVQTTDDPPVAVRRAIVTLSGSGLGVDRSVVTDDSGHFTFDRLPVGSFTVTATKAAYLPASFGARRPGHPGTPIALAAGQRIDQLVLRMARGGVIAGTIRDALGAPLAGVQVMAVRQGDPPPQISFVRPGSREGVLTDDRGGYRLFGLAPGSYTILALASTAQQDEMHRRTMAEVDAAAREAQAKGTAAPVSPAPPPPVFTAAPVYFPGTPIASQATAIDVTAGSSHEDESFIVDLFRSASIEGTVSPVSGPGWGTLVISGNGSAMPLTMAMAPHLFQDPGADGRFTYTNVAPGHYTISAFAKATPSVTPSPGNAGGFSGTGPAVASDVTMWATAEVDVDGNDIAGLSLVLQPALTVTGRLEFDATTEKVPADLTTIRVSMVPLNANGTGSSNSTNYGAPQKTAFVLAKADGTFEVRGLTPGTYRVLVNTTGASGVAGFSLRSAMTSDGRDAIDTNLLLAPGRSVEGLVVRLTDRHTELSGALGTPAGRPATDYVVVVLPEDRSLWMENARRIRSTRPATDGQFSFADLAPGGYLLAAVDDLEPGDLNNRTFLESIAAASVKVTLADGDKKRQDLRLTGGGSYRP